jgi:uncharacterized phage protein (TIGR02220 family)
MNHSFNIDVAKQIGIAPAVILNNIYWWIEKNKANDKHFYNGYYWTYNSRKAFCTQFPYLTERQIEYALRKLINEGYVITGNYNKASFDRTLWYAITNKGYCILQNCEMERTNFVNAKDKNVKAIPDINTDSKNTDRENVEQGSTLSLINEIINYLNKQAGTKYRASSTDTKKHITARIKEGYTISDFKRVIDIKVNEWKYDKKMAPYLRPSTLFGTKFESYLNQCPSYNVSNNESKESEELATDENGNPIVF